MSEEEVRDNICSSSSCCVDAAAAVAADHDDDDDVSEPHCNHDEWLYHVSISLTLSDVEDAMVHA